MKKVLSIIAPCHNSEDYLEKCVNSLVAVRDDIEIILASDGPKDETPELIDQFAQKCPEQIIPIHQANAGYDGALNKGFSIAGGEYIKVVDSDDWVGYGTYLEIVAFLKHLIQKKQSVDLLTSNYIYDKVDAKHKEVVHFPHLSKNKFFGWDNVKLYLGQYLMMYSLIYRRKVITNGAHLQLPTHVSCDDNMYTSEPLRHARKMYYLDVNFYHYFIGREDQSVNESVMPRKIDQQLLINERVIKLYAERIGPNTSLGKYMKFYLEIITAVSSTMLTRNKKSEYVEKKDELWRYVKIKNPRSCRSLKRRPLGIYMNLPTRLGNKIASGFYIVTRLVYGFN